jgi:flagellar biosynthetic protein FliR
MITVTTAQLNAWLSGILWPLSRILGLIAVAPLFGNVSVPITIKVALGILLSLIVAPTLTGIPVIDPMSLDGLLVLMQQSVIGIAMGFAMQIVFAGVELAGDTAGMTMGLGFATFFDPQSQGRTSAISQLLALLTLMIFLATNLHLVLLSTLVDSFNSMPISTQPMNGDMARQLVGFGGRIFSAGVQLSLPIVAALLVTNAALGILTRAAPQLNIFGIGFPITISVGFIMLALTLPYLAMPVDRLFQEAFDTIRHMTAALPPVR